jgi:cbb3-type cytochrome oxidase subunit 3
MIACFSASLFLVFILGSMFAFENRKRDKKRENNNAQESEFMNLTDRENRGFQVSRALLNTVRRG